MPDDPPVKIALSGVRKEFDDGFLLHDIDMNVRDGEMFVLIGPSAAGKTVIIKTIAGLHQADAGSIRINDKETAGLGVQDRDSVARMGVLFQRSALFDSLTVWENITFRYARLKKLRKAAAIEFATTKLAAVGLDSDTALLYPSELSGGMQKRVGLARALADEPEILLLDEPTAGLDPIMTSLIVDRLRFNLARLRATTVMATSSPTTARAVADSVGLLRDGRMVWSGPAESLERCDDPFVERFVRGKTEMQSRPDSTHAPALASGPGFSASSGQ